MAQGGAGFFGWLKRQAEIASSVGVLAGGAAAVIVFFGGSVPPWYTPAQAKEDQRQAAQIQRDTVDALGKLNARFESLQKRVDLSDCATFLTRMAQAQAALRKNPADPLAEALRDTTQLQMRQIQGCAP